MLSPNYARHVSATPELGHQPQDLPFATLLMAAEQAHPVNIAAQHSSHYQHSGYQQVEPTMMPPPIQQQQQQQHQHPVAMPTDSILPPSFTGIYDFEDSLNDLATFMDSNSTFHFSSYINAEQPMPFFSPEAYSNHQEVLPSTEVHLQRSLPPMDVPDDHGSFSRYGSRLPSLQPEENTGNDKHLRDDLAASHRSISDVTQEDRQKWLTKLHDFSHILPAGFQLPTRLALSRYVAGYINGFHEHLPFLHVPTMSADTCCIELFLAMAAVGAQYCFEGEKGVELFTISQAIAAQRIRQRDSRLAAFHKHVEASGGPPTNGFDHNSDTPRSCSVSGPLGLPSHFEEAGTLLQKEDLIQTAQALLILMAMATWAKHREILREALAIQSILATLVRDDGLKTPDPPSDVDWRTWARHETCKRTKFIVYAFFNLHCIVYNIPALILNSEIGMTLPCNAAEFKALSETKWRDARAKSMVTSVGFQDALARLFSRGNGQDSAAYNSSLGNYVLVHALIQHIFFVRQVSRQRMFNSGESSSISAIPTSHRSIDLIAVCQCRCVSTSSGPALYSILCPSPSLLFPQTNAPSQPGEIPTEDISSIEHALRNWQLAWKRNPESSLDPMNPNGPVTFNSTALLRLAYIRLNVDIGPGRALDTRDPIQIARAFRDSPALSNTAHRTSPKLLRAVLHSAHALSIPIKIGIHLVAQTQTFNWSIQHSLCTLECAYLLSKWLEALSTEEGLASMSADERKIARLVKTMLDETEFAVPDEEEDGEGETPAVNGDMDGGDAAEAKRGNGNRVIDSPATMKYLSASVLRVWAKVFRGAQTWAIVDIIGSGLNL